MPAPPAKLHLSKGLVASDALTASSALSASRVWIWSSRQPTSLLRIPSLSAQLTSAAYMTQLSELT